jgi:serine/threonine protein kinase
MTDFIGKQIGNYRITERLGWGKFGDVYLGKHIHLDYKAAIKVLCARLSKNEDIESFRKEAQTIATLQHPNIVGILEFGFNEERMPYIVMKYASKGSLRKNHPEGIPLELSLIVSYVKQIADALQYAHGREVIHRDIKPANILIDDQGNILLSDFGLAVTAHSEYSRSTDQEGGGTPLYMAPEQGQGKECPASDQYALGIVVYEWLVGRCPFQGNIVQVIWQHAKKRPPSLAQQRPDLPKGMEKVVFRALHKNPKKRFACVQDFAEALEWAYRNSSSFSTGATVPLPQHVTAPTPPQPTPSPISRRLIITSAVSTGLVIFGGATAIVIGSALANPGTPTPISQLSPTPTLGPSPTPTPKPSPTPTAKPSPTPTQKPSVNPPSENPSTIIFDHNQPTGQFSTMAPTLALYNNDTFSLAFTDTNRGNSLTLLSSKDGKHWLPPRNTGQTSNGSPALAVVENTFYLAFVAKNNANDLLVISSEGGDYWNENPPIGQASKASPALTFWRYKHKLYMAFVANNDTNYLLVISSEDGQTWVNEGLVKQPSKGSPALAALNDTLYMAFIDTNNDLQVVSSKDGKTWDSSLRLASNCQYSPTLAVWNDTTLYLAFVANNAVSLTSSNDGHHWTPSRPMGQDSQAGPALAFLQDVLYMAFIANNSTNELLTVASKR